MLNMIILAAMAAQSAISETTPEFTTALSAATLSTGFCGLFYLPAEVRLTWAASGFSPSNHEYRVYEDEILVSTQFGTTYDKFLRGLVENHNFFPAEFSWDFRVDVVRKSDSAVLASSSTTWTKIYGQCLG